MPAPVPSTERERPPEDGGEWETLTVLLDFLRATVVTKVAGLTDEQAARAAVAPSTLTPASLVKHLTGVERHWFSIEFAGDDLPAPWTSDDPHGSFRLSAADTLEAVVEGYRAECERSRAAVDGASLNDHAQGRDVGFTLRYAIAHMIEETARHCGHLDLLREAIDGTTGE